MAHIDGYAYSDGTTKYRAVNSLLIEEQPSSPMVTTARLAAPAVFGDALSQWQILLNALTPAGLYAITYNATTKRVTIASTNATNFRPVFAQDQDLARWLGFDPNAAFGFALSHTGTAIPLGRVECLGIDIEPPEDAAKVDLQQLRLGRAVAPVFGNHLLVTVALMVVLQSAPAAWHWVVTGRVRLYPSSNTSPYSESNLGGYIDGWVVTQPAWEQLGDDESLSVLTLLLALPRS